MVNEVLSLLVEGLVLVGERIVSFCCMFWIGFILCCRLVLLVLLAGFGFV